MDTVNCCFVWFLWNVNVSQRLHKPLNKFDWSKIQLVAWQNNQRYLKFCLLIFLFHLLVECFFLMDDLFFFLFACLWMLRVTWWLLPHLQVWQVMTLVDAVPSISSGPCPEGSDVWGEEILLTAFHPSPLAYIRLLRSDQSGILLWLLLLLLSFSEAW